jgi:hypothetical protein
MSGEKVSTDENHGGSALVTHNTQPLISLYP